MSNVLLRIEVNPDAESEKLGDIANYVDGTGTNSNIANTSYQADDNGLYGDDAEGKSSGFNGLSLAQPLVFNSEGYLDNADKNGGVLGDEDNPTEFIWGAVPESGEYSVTLMFSNATSLKDIVVYGDEKAGQFPTTAIIDGTTTISNDDYRWAISMEEASDTHTIEFTTWNKVNYNACLAGITVMLRYYDVDKSAGLTSIEHVLQSTDDGADLDFKVMPSTGTAELLDRKGELKDLINDGIVAKSNTDVSLVFNDNVIAQGKIKELTAYDTSDEVYLTLEDILGYKDRQKYTSNYVSYYYLSIYGGSLRLSFLVANLMLSFGCNSLDEAYSLMQNTVFYEESSGVSVYTHLYRFKFIPYFPDLDNINDLLDMICEVAGLNLSLDNGGNLKYTNAFPKRLDLRGDSNAIRIPLKYQYSTPQRALMDNTVYDNTRYSRRKITKGLATILDETYDVKDLINAVVDGDYTSTLQELFDEDASVEIDEDNGCFYLNFFYNFSSDTDCFDVFNYQNSEGGVLKISRTIDGTTKTILNSQSILSNYKSGSKDELDFIDLTDDHVYTCGFCLMNSYSTPTSQVFAFSVSLPYTSISYDYSINIQVMGYHYIINQISEDETYNDGENVYDLPDNDFMVTNTVYNDEKTAYEYLSDNVIESFSNGINTLNITVSASDYYATNGTLMLDASQGEIFDIDDMVVIDKDNNGNSRYIDKNGMDIVWRVTGRTFRKKGVPYIDLELQEVPNDKSEPVLTYATGGSVIIDDVTYYKFLLMPYYSTTKIYCTLDKSIPTTSSNLYDGQPFLRSADETLYIYAFACENELRTKYYKITVSSGSTKVSTSSTATEWA